MGNIPAGTTIINRGHQTGMHGTLCAQTGQHRAETPFLDRPWSFASVLHVVVHLYGPLPKYRGAAGTVLYLFVGWNSRKYGQPGFF